MFVKVVVLGAEFGNNYEDEYKGASNGGEEEGSADKEVGGAESSKKDARSGDGESKNKAEAEEEEEDEEEEVTTDSSDGMR